MSDEMTTRKIDDDDNGTLFAIGMLGWTIENHRETKTIVQEPESGCGAVLLFLLLGAAALGLIMGVMA